MKAREVNPKIIQELLDETTPEELEKIEQPMEEQKIEYWFDKSQTLRKSIILYRQVGSVASPIMYLSKPKWMSNDEFFKIFKSMQFYVKKQNNKK